MSKRELPILLNSKMVRVTLNGTKTQTRRMIKPQPDHRHRRIDFEQGVLKESSQIGGCWNVVRKTKPKYQVGDLLYVRETWRVSFVYPENSQYGHRIGIMYHGVPRGETKCFETQDDSCKSWAMKSYDKPGLWRPSIHMPKWAARIWLEVVAVRVERLQDINEADCMAEGIREVTKDDSVFKYCIYDKGDYSKVPWSEMPRSPIPVFKNLWNSIYKNWDKNPWVWVYEFKRIDKTKSKN